MNRIRKTAKILVGFFVIVNLTISMGYGSVIEHGPRIASTELLIAKVDDKDRPFQFRKAQLLVGISNTINFDFRKFVGFNNLQKVDNDHLLHLKIQNRSVLNYNAFLLHIVLNAIVQQKSHWL